MSAMFVIGVVGGAFLIWFVGSILPKEAKDVLFDAKSVLKGIMITAVIVLLVWGGNLLRLYYLVVKESIHLPPGYGLVGWVTLAVFVVAALISFLSKMLGDGVRQLMESRRAAQKKASGGKGK